MLSGIELENLKQHYENLTGMDRDTYDWESMDSTLSYFELKTLLEDELGKSKNTNLEKMDVYQHLQEEGNEHYLSNLIEAPEDLSRFYNIPVHFIRMVAGGYANSLVLVSEAGLGKSFLVLKTLSDIGLQINRDYVYINSYTTPLALYNLLYQHDDKLLIFDDVEGIFEDRKAISILKAALWNSTGKRTIDYHSTSKKVEVSSFEFKGRIIFCTNHLPKNKVISPVLSRIYYHFIRFTKQEIIEIMHEIAKEQYQNLSKEDRMDVVTYIKDNCEYSKISLRTLIKGYELYSYNKDVWTELLQTILDNDAQTNSLEDMILSEIKKAGGKIELKELVEKVSEKLQICSRSGAYKIIKKLECESKIHTNGFRGKEVRL